MEKYKMTLSKDFNNLFNRLESSSQIYAKDRSDVIRRAVALYSYLHEQVAAEEGCKVAIIDKENNPKIVIDPLP